MLENLKHYSNFYSAIAAMGVLQGGGGRSPPVAPAVLPFYHDGGLTDVTSVAAVQSTFDKKATRLDFILEIAEVVVL